MTVHLVIIPEESSDVRKARYKMAAIENCMQANVVQLFNGQICENTMYFVTKGDPVTLAMMTGLANDLYDDLVSSSNWLAHRSQNWSSMSIVIRDLTAASSLMYEFTDGLPLVGVDTSAASNQQALVVTFYTADNSRSFRGRNFWCAVTNDVLNRDSTWTSAMLSQVASAYIPLLLYGEDESKPFSWVVGSKLLGDTALITHVAPRAIVASQAQRKVGRGS